MPIARLRSVFLNRNGQGVLSILRETGPSSAPHNYIRWFQLNPHSGTRVKSYLGFSLAELVRLRDYLDSTISEILAKADQDPALRSRIEAGNKDLLIDLERAADFAKKHPNSDRSSLVDYCTGRFPGL